MGQSGLWGIRAFERLLSRPMLGLAEPVVIIQGEVSHGRGRLNESWLNNSSRNEQFHDAIAIQQWAFEEIRRTPSKTSGENHVQIIRTDDIEYETGAHESNLFSYPAVQQGIVWRTLERMFLFLFSVDENGRIF